MDDKEIRDFDLADAFNGATGDTYLLLVMLKLIHNDLKALKWLCCAIMVVLGAVVVRGLL